MHWLRVEIVELYTLWNSTRQQVAALHRAVERGERITEAIHFAKYLICCGIIRELKRNNKNTEAHESLVVDGALLEWEVSELLQLALRVPEHRRLASFEERVIKNLDLIAGQVLKLSPPVSASATPTTAGGDK